MPNRSTQEGILFFKLYLLARHNNYVEYMAAAQVLRQWFDWKKEFIDVEQANIICGNCFNTYASVFGGGILHTCHRCDNQSNWGYELNRLTVLTNLPFHTCMYLLCKAVADIYKYGSIEQLKNVCSHN